jgi:MFS family permease
VKTYAVQMMSSAALFASMFLIPMVLKDELGVPEAGIGLVVAAYATALLLSAWAFGRLADVRGRRKLLQAGLLICTVVSALQFFARTTESLIAIRVVMGFVAGIFPGALMAYAYEATGKAGKFASFGALGWGIGTLGAGVVAVWSLFAPFLVSTALFAIAFLVSLTMPFPKEVHLKVPLFPKEVIKRNGATYAAMLLRHTGANMIWVIYPIFLAEINPDPFWIGVVYTVNAGTQFVIMQLLDKFDGRRLLAWGLALSALTFFLFSISREGWMILLDQVVLGSSWACTYVGALKCILEKNVERSTSSGLLDSTLSLSMIIGSIIGGAVAGLFGHVATMWVAMLMAIVALVLHATVLNGRTRAASAQTPGPGPA